MDIRSWETHITVSVPTGMGTKVKGWSLLLDLAESSICPGFSD